MPGNKIIDSMTEQQAKAKVAEMFHLLLEARDALPAISISAARLHNVSLTLDKRIEAALEPWRIE